MAFCRSPSAAAANSRDRLSIRWQRWAQPAAVGKSALQDAANSGERSSVNSTMNDLKSKLRDDPDEKEAPQTKILTCLGARKSSRSVPPERLWFYDTGTSLSRRFGRMEPQPGPASSERKRFEHELCVVVERAGYSNPEPLPASRTNYRFDKELHSVLIPRPSAAPRHSVFDRLELAVFRHDERSVEEEEEEERRLQRRKQKEKEREWSRKEEERGRLREEERGRLREEEREDRRMREERPRDKSSQRRYGDYSASEERGRSLGTSGDRLDDSRSDRLSASRRPGDHYDRRTSLLGDYEKMRFYSARPWQASVSRPSSSFDSSSQSKSNTAYRSRQASRADSEFVHDRYVDDRTRVSWSNSRNSPPSHSDPPYFRAPQRSSNWPKKSRPCDGPWLHDKFHEVADL